MRCLRVCSVAGLSVCSLVHGSGVRGGGAPPRIVLDLEGVSVTGDYSTPGDDPTFTRSSDMSSEVLDMIAIDKSVTCAAKIADRDSCPEPQAHAYDHHEGNITEHVVKVGCARLPEFGLIV